LIPLSCQGLCEAEIDTPDEAPSARTSSATPGVVIVPAHRTSPPEARMPPASSASSSGVDSRVSPPTTTAGSPSSRGGRALLRSGARRGSGGNSPAGLAGRRSRASFAALSRRRRRGSRALHQPDPHRDGHDRPSRIGLPGRRRGRSRHRQRRASVAMGRRWKRIRSASAARSHDPRHAQLAWTSKFRIPAPVFPRSSG
jgi:hypothetical protein